MKIRYNANPRKIMEALVWVAKKRPGKGFHFILKTLFYADKIHLQRYGRPVTGDVYIKMANGPVASLAYDMLKKRDMLPSEVLHELDRALEVRTVGHPSVFALRSPDAKRFSGTDLDCLEEALGCCDGKGFGSLSKTTHQEAAWQLAEMNGEMSFEHFIGEEVEGREELIEYMRETAPSLAL